MASKYLAADSLPDWFPIHHFNEPRWNYKTGVELFKFDEPSLWVFIGMTAFNPIFWNTVARNEYKNKTITKIVKSPYVGCYILAASIFWLSAFRDSLFLRAVKAQPSMAILNNDLVRIAGVAFFTCGQVFVLSSMWALGVTGTYLGDYFGILMKKRVTGFPFNVLQDPMYVGSFLSHIGTALWYESPAGVVLAFWILAVYMAALQFEGPFTDKIYSAKTRRTRSTPSSTTATPKRSASRKSVAASSTKKEETYAAAVANGGPKTTPKTKSTPKKSTRSGGKSEPASPHMTRSKTGTTPRRRRGAAASSDE